MSKTTKTPCACAAFSVVTWDEAKQDWNTSATTGCSGTLTGRTFAPGHDAKLKGFLIRAGLGRNEVSDDQGITTSAERMADRFGFGHMVKAGIELGRAKTAEKADKKRTRKNKAEARNDRENAKLHDGNEARKAREFAALVEAENAAWVAEQAATQPEPEWNDEPATVKAKVGRWTYSGTVAGDTLTYTDAKGTTKTTTKFSLI